MAVSIKAGKAPRKGVSHHRRRWGRRKRLWRSLARKTRWRRSWGTTCRRRTKGRSKSWGGWSTPARCVVVVVSFCALELWHHHRASERHGIGKIQKSYRSLRARATSFLSLSLLVLRDPRRRRSLTKPVRSLSLHLSNFARRSETDDRGVQTIAKATRSGEPVLLLPRRFGV